MTPITPVSEGSSAISISYLPAELSLLPQARTGPGVSGALAGRGGNQPVYLLRITMLRFSSSAVKAAEWDRASCRGMGPVSSPIVPRPV